MAVLQHPGSYTTFLERREALGRTAERAGPSEDLSAVSLNGVNVDPGEDGQGFGRKQRIE